MQLLKTVYSMETYAAEDLGFQARLVTNERVVTAPALICRRRLLLLACHVTWEHSVGIVELTCDRYCVHPIAASLGQVLGSCSRVEGLELVVELAMA